MKPVPAWRALGFDLDDTLYPEWAFVRNGFAAVARWAEGELGKRAEDTARELMVLFRAGVRSDTFDRWLSSKGLPVQDYRRRMVEVYRNPSGALDPYPDVVPALRRLRRRGYSLGLATEGRSGVQEVKLEALGLKGCFAAVVILGDRDRHRWKPEPWPLLELARALGTTPAEMVYVGDNPAKDFAAARRAGMKGVRMRRADGLHVAEEAADAQGAPDVEVKDMIGLEDWLRRAGAEPA